MGPGAQCSAGSLDMTVIMRTSPTRLETASRRGLGGCRCACSGEQPGLHIAVRFKFQSTTVFLAEPGLVQRALVLARRTTTPPALLQGLVRRLHALVSGGQTGSSGLLPV